MSKEYKLLIRNEDELYDLIENEINKKFTFKKLCKDIELDEGTVRRTTEGSSLMIDENISEDFKQNQCYYMCSQNLSSIKKCKNNSIDNIIINSRQVKKLKILKKTFVSDDELSIVTVASTKINGIENKIIIKDFYDEYEMMYELFISNVLKSDPNIEKHICGYFGKKSNTSKLLLEYIQGKTITEMTKLSMKDFSDIMSQIFLTLNYAYNKYGFLHGDLHLDNFLVLHDSTNKFDIELFLSNGKSIKYKSNYKIVFIDFGLSHLTYKFNKDNNNANVLMIPLEQDILGFDYSIPLVDITKLLVFIMIEIIYENKHNKLTEVSIYITKFIEQLYSIIGKPNKQINFNFFKKARSEYGYIYDLINSNLELSFEELYIMFVSNTRMDIHKISEYFNKDEQLSLKEDLEEQDDNDNILTTIQNITNENIKIDEKIDTIKDYIKELNLGKLSNSENSKSKLHSERLKYICINFFHYLCKYELNKNIFIDESEMIYIINNIYLKFYNNKIIKELSENEKYKVIDNMIEFKLNKFLDCFLKNIDIHNILIKYNKLTELSKEQAIEFEKQNMNKILKKLLIKNYIKMPFKIFQKNFIDNEINVKKYNSVEQIKFLSNIVLELKKQMEKLNISNKSVIINIEKFKNINKNIQNISYKSEYHHLHLFFYNIYKYCSQYSSNIVEQSKFEFIDWISYNKILLYDYFISHITLINLPKGFTELYLNIIELDEDIWEKFYKKDDFKEFANSLTFSENMLQLIVNKDFSKILSKFNLSESNNKIKENINKYKNVELNKYQINQILSQFKKMYR